MGEGCCCYCTVKLMTSTCIGISLLSGLTCSGQFVGVGSRLQWSVCWCPVSLAVVSLLVSGLACSSQFVGVRSHLQWSVCWCPVSASSSSGRSTPKSQPSVSTQHSTVSSTAASTALTSCPPSSTRRTSGNDVMSTELYPTHLR